MWLEGKTGGLSLCEVEVAEPVGLWESYEK